MAFEIVLPTDTQNEIEEYVRTHFTGHRRLLATDALEHEMEVLRANPTLGAAPLGTPLETRRVHRFTVVIDHETNTVEYLYNLNSKAQTITIYGFRSVPAAG